MNHRSWPQSVVPHHFDRSHGIDPSIPGRISAVAYKEFDAYDRALPGNPNSAFFKGLSLEAMQDRQGAAREYSRYLQQVQSGAQAKHAATQLRAWGYAK